MNLKIAKVLWIFQLCFIASTMNLNAQNLNNPNKRGPLGTQVNTLTGNMFLQRTDIYIPARMLDINISFSYNSFLFTEDYGYGKGWTFRYNIRYKNDSIPGARLILWGDGREDKYDSLPGGGYQSPKGFFNTFSQYQPGKYLLTEPDGMKYFFDNPVHKGITRMEEPNGNFINFTYTDSLLTGLTNAAGQTINFTYNAQGHLATVVDAVAAPSRTYTYSYDSGGNLTEVKDPLNGTCKYSYLVNGPMKDLSDKNNNKVNIIYFPDLTARELIGCNKRLSFSYDSSSNSTVVTDYLEAGNQVTIYKYKTVGDKSWVISKSGNCCGFNVSYEYDNQGNATKVTDANGQVYTYTFDSTGNMLTATNPLGEVSTYTYSNSFNKITSYTDPKGNIYTLSYDIKGNLLQLIAPGNLTYSATYNATGDILSSTDPKGNVYNYNYDAWGNPSSVTGPNGYNAVLSFDARGNLLSFTDARGNNSTAEYDILNRLKKITDPINYSVQFTYDAEGNILTLKNKNNETSLYHYDASNRLVQLTGPTGNMVSFSYDGMNNLLSGKNALNYESRLSYDKLNRVKSYKNAEGYEISFSYDGNGNITGANLPNGRVLNYTYDNLNRLVAVSDGEGTIGSAAYDKIGNITSYTNGTGAITTATYDNLNRINSITDPLGNTSSYVYDNNSNIITITDREGKTSHYTYDGLNRVATYTDNNGFVITVGYDATSNITSLTDQNNNVTTYTYDNLNRRKRMTYPDGKYNELNYDPEGNISSIRQTDASIITFQYDTLNRIIGRSLPGGEVYSFTYDKLNRVLTATNNNGTVTFTYDKLNRVTSEAFDGRTTSYSYNIAGRVQTITYPDGSVVQKEFDNRNRLIKILKDSVLIVSYAYNNANQLTQKTFSNGVSSIMQYDIANRLSSLSTTAASRILQNSLFSYDKEYNKTAITRIDNPSLSEQFSYDNGYRLTNYKRGPAGSPLIQNSYTYDAVGNRTAANLNGTATTYTINNLNQLIAVNGTNFNFDNRGNITYDGTFYKTYDAENRLVKDSSSPAAVITYSYDAIGRRITKTVNGNLLKYTYCGVAQIEERNSSNLLLNSTIYNGILSPLVNENNGNRYYYHSNEMGSVEAISNSNGRLMESYQYDIYGKLSRYDSLNNPLAASLTGNRFGFTGQEFDSASNSYRFFYRNYSPVTGVFNQRDLIEYRDGMGMYQYVGNNPANGVDVLGLSDCDEPGSQDIAYEVSFSSSAGLILESEWIANIDNPFPTGSVGEVDINLKKYKLLMEKSIKYRMGPNSNKKLANFFSSQANDLLPGIKKDLGIRNSKIKVFNVKNAKNAKALKSVGRGLTFLDNLVKGEAFLSSLVDGEGNPQNTQEIKAGIDFGLSLAGWTPQGAAYGAFDFVMETTSGDGFTTHTASTGAFLGDVYSAYESDRPVKMQWGRPASWDENVTSGNFYAFMMYGVPYNELQTPTDPCSPPAGTTKKFRWVWDEEKQMWVKAPLDPNEIIGPAGKPDKAWVSVKDRMPYTILFENDSSASARARYIKITSPVEPKQDAATFELGSVGFNNQSFEIPLGRSFYYQRLDAVDSTGVFVDLTAGYDITNHQLFWEFQAIDPNTLLPPDDPNAGFLFLQDTAQSTYGHGFVNFSIKPKTDAQTLDTIGAKAFIVFDQNDTIPTNTYTNTIDALPPVSQMNTITGNGNNPITLTWSGADDMNGCGIDFYTIYVSEDQINYTVLFPKIQRTDTTFSLPPGHTYCFFVLATDRVGNAEELRANVIQCYELGGPLPVSWLYFNGTNQDKDNLLKWGTASEQNSKEFWLERSFDGIEFNQIATIPAAGNSSTTRNYEYRDRNIDQYNRQVFFYRLKQVDLDNNFKHSSVVRLSYNSISQPTPTIVYPNPTNGIINIRVGDASQVGTEATVRDINGRLLKRIKISSTTQPISLREFVNGIYLISLANKETLKVIKQ